MKADRLSCHRFLANQFRLLLHACAYWLMDALRRKLTEGGMRRIQLDTLRLRLIKTDKTSGTLFYGPLSTKPIGPGQRYILGSNRCQRNWRLRRCAVRGCVSSDQLVCCGDRHATLSE
jgi:Transposase DDE domain group 1